MCNAIINRCFKLSLLLSVIGVGAASAQVPMQPSTRPSPVTLPPIPVSDPGRAVPLASGVANDLVAPDLFTRQAFVYTQENGRDPVQPPAELAAGGATNASLTVTAVMMGRRPGGSLAVVRAVGFVEDRYVVHVGSHIDDYTVTSISPDALRLSIPLLGGRTSAVTLVREKKGKASHDALPETFQATPGDGRGAEPHPAGTPSITGQNHD